MKFFIPAMLFLVSVQCYSKCPVFKRNQRPKALIINFDGLFISEFGGQLLHHNIGKKIVSKCRNKEVISTTFYYGKSSAKKAYLCAKQLKEKFPKLSINVFGHSYGGGKGVFNFLDELVDDALFTLDNVVTFDPRGYSYQYENPGTQYIKKFINIYQRNPLRGMLVQNANYQEDVTGTADHGSLPKVHAQKVMKKLVKGLSCAN